jgi:hypothetical protein
MTSGGARVRDAYGQFLSGLATFDRLAQRIGLRRRALQLPTVQEYLRRGAGGGV